MASTCGVLPAEGVAVVVGVGVAAALASCFFFSSSNFFSSCFFLSSSAISCCCCASLASFCSNFSSGRSLAMVSTSSCGNNAPMPVDEGTGCVVGVGLE